MKTLEDFKQEVAEKYESHNWKYLTLYEDNESIENLCNEAAELYADYKEWNAKHSNWAEGFTDGHKQGWNEALHWAAKEAKVYSKLPYEVNPQSILKGLKP